MLALVRGLDELGETERENDLSPGAQAATRRAVAEVLSRPAPSRIVPFPAPALAMRLAHACGWMLFVLGAVLVFTQRDRIPVPGPSAADAPSVMVAEWDTRIRSQRTRVSRHLEDFTATYLARSAADPFKSRTSELRRRIEVCSLQAQRELRLDLR